MDLAVASPATVSRCGMVYLEPHQLGWWPLVESWIEYYADDNPVWQKAMEEDNALDGIGTIRSDSIPQSFNSNSTATPSNSQNRLQSKKDPRMFVLAIEHRQILRSMCQWLLEPCLYFLRKGGLKEVTPTSDGNVITSLLRLLECMIEELLVNADGMLIGDLKLQPGQGLTNSDFECIFLFTLVWAIGGAVIAQDRPIFSEFLQSVLSNTTSFTGSVYFQAVKQRGWSTEFVRQLSNPIPLTSSVFDSFYSPQLHKWKSWSETLEAAQIPQNAAFADIIVPTVTSEQLNYLFKLHFTHQKPLLVCGSTGTGKSTYVSGTMLRKLSKDVYIPSLVTFSARTTANQTQVSSFLLSFFLFSFFYVIKKDL